MEAPVFTNVSGLLRTHLQNEHQLKDPSWSYECRVGGCNKKMPLRELRRHLATVKFHRTASTPVFRCRCEKQFTRKEKYQIHFRESTCSGQSSYHCCCGKAFSSQSNSARREHERHVKICGRKRRGRPSQRTGNTTEKDE